MGKKVLLFFIFYLSFFIFSSKPVQAACSTDNLACQQSVNANASSCYGNNCTNFGAWKALDGDYSNTRWQANVTNNTPNQWIEFEFGAGRSYQAGVLKAQLVMLTSSLASGSGTIRMFVNGYNEAGTLVKQYVHNDGQAYNGKFITLGLGNTSVHKIRITFTIWPSGGYYPGFADIELYTPPNCSSIQASATTVQAGSSVNFQANYNTALSSGDRLATGMVAQSTSGWPWQPSWDLYTTSPQNQTKTYTWTNIPAGIYTVSCRAGYYSGHWGSVRAQCGTANYAAYAGAPAFTCAGPNISTTLNVCPANVTISGSVSGLPAGTEVTITINGVGQSTVNHSYSKTVPSAQDYTIIAGAVSGYTVAPTSASITKICGNTTQNFTYTPIAIADAGTVTSTGTIDAGTGQVSQSGNPPGFRLENYTVNSAALKAQVSYNNLLNAVIKNSGVGSTANLESQVACQPPGFYNTGTYDFYCYDGPTSFNNQLNAAFGGNGSASRTLVLYPINPSSSVTFTPPVSLNGRKIIVFIDFIDDNNSLTISTNNLVVQPLTNTGIIFILKKGGVSVASSVGRLDGVYIFPGEFNDGNSAIQLVGNGSLIGTGTTSLGFSRSTPGNTPAELWTYQPKYLELFRQSLAVPRYTWKELPPQ